MNQTSEKAIRRELAQEEKDEETRVRHAIKDISLATKEQQKAHKAIRKADSTVTKLGKKESVATAAVQKATHEHDIAATNLRSAQRDAELKRQEDTRLQRELDEKKARLDTALQEQKIHKKGRESRLLELESGRNDNRAVDSAAVGAGIAGAAGHPGTHPTGAQGESTSAGNIGTRSADYTASGTTGNVPGQDGIGTGTQAPGTRAAGPGYAGHHTTEGVAGPAGHGAHRDIIGQGYGDDRIRDGDSSGVGQIRTVGDQATNEPSGVAHRSDAGVGTGAYAGERSIGSGVNARQPAIRGGPNTDYPREGPGDFGRPGNIPPATGPNQYAGEQAIPGQVTGYPSATTGAGYSGAGGENLGFRGDPMLGGSGTGADPGIRSGGAHDIGGRSGSREFIGERNVGMGGVGEPRYGGERVGDQQYIHRGTGIGGRQGVGEDPEFSRDRMVMGGADRLGPGMKQTGDIDSGAQGPMMGNQGFGEDSMPGGYVQGTSSGGLDIVKERF